MTRIFLLAVITFFTMSLPLRAEETTPEASEPTSSGYGKTEGMFGKFLVAPKLTLVGFPVPFRFGLETKWDNFIGASFDYGFFPKLSISDVSIKLNGWNLAAKIYPWKKSFFVGLGFGGQTFTGTQRDITTGALVTIDFATTYFAPHIGWRWTGKNGFFFGMELGVQIPMSTKATTTTDPVVTGPTVETAKADIESAANTFGKQAFPHFALIQIGYFL